MSAVASGIVYLDSNENGIQDGGESGSEGHTIQFRRSGSVAYSTTSTNTGFWEIDVGFDFDTYTVRCVPLPGFYVTSTNDIALVLPVSGSFTGPDFGVAPAPIGTVKTCVRPESSWIAKICWVPSFGVQVTFKDRSGVPNFTCFYPGTTYDDYLLFVAVASKGEHLHDFFYGRPYVPSGLDP